MYPANIGYAETHEWGRMEGNILTLGITFYAQDQIKKKGGGLTYVGINAPDVPPGRCVLPEIGAKVTRGEEFMLVESSKATSAIISPANGKIVAVNEKLTYKKNLDLVHHDPYGDGWFVKIEVENFDPSVLMDAEAYQKFLEG